MIGSHESIPSSISCSVLNVIMIVNGYMHNTIVDLVYMTLNICKICPFIYKATTVTNHLQSDSIGDCDILLVATFKSRHRNVKWHQLLR